MKRGVIIGVIGVAALATLAGLWLWKHTRTAVLTRAELAPWVQAPTPPRRITEGCPEVKQAMALPSSPPGSGHEKPTKNTAPLGADEIAVYRAVLEQWLSQGRSSLNVSDVTYLLDLTSDRNGMNCDCLQDIYLEDSSAFHSFHELTSDILPRKGAVLVDPAKQSQMVRANDPDRTMRMGKTADEAVNNAFATGLFSLSEIAFDRSHHYAVVRYGFWCGSLCGSGATLVLQKIAGEWRITDRQCGGWIS